MTALISRADAIKTVIRKCSPICAWQVGTQQYPDSVVAEINALPSADAVQGEWEKTTDGNGWNEWHVLKCPLCDATIEDKQNRKWEYNYCPNCGARMTPYKGGDTE